MTSAPLLCVLALAPATPQSQEQQALWTAIDDLRRSIAMYDAMVQVQPKRRPFKWIARQKRRHERRLVAVTVDRGLGDPPVLWDPKDFVAPRDRVEGCAAGKRQELRNAAIYETALGVVDAPRARAVLRRMLQKTRYRHLVTFEACIAAG
jgi:hypothetical protein